MKQFDQKIWKLMFNKLFSDKTHLFYDFGIEGMERKDFLPTPEIINAQIPNPCGWCTGMEDGMINGGVMLDAAVEGEKLGYKNMKEYASKIFKGFVTCATVSESEGFLARTVSEIDGCAHYMDSSRDQYTHWIFSGANYLGSGMASAEEEEFIKKTLCAFAYRAKRNVIKENDYNLLREDNKKGIAVKMWDVNAHEWMRLPMIYLAAWKIGKDNSFKDEYYRYRDAALENSEKVQLENYKRLFALHQMQISLRFVYDYDTDEDFRARCLLLMKRTAKYCRKKVLEAVNAHKENDLLKDKLFVTTPWNKLNAEFWGFNEGYAYYVPKSYKSDFTCTVADLQICNVGDGASTHVLVPDAAFDAALYDALNVIGNSIDYNTYLTDTVSHLLYPYYALERIKNTCKNTEI
jgi:hypothetical protein